MNKWKVYEEATVKTVVEERRYVVSVPMDETVGQVLQILSAHNIISAVVVAEDKKKVVGIVEMLDLVSLAVGVAQQDSDTNSFQKLEGHLFSEQKVGQLIKNKQYAKYSPSTPLNNVIQEFCSGSRRAVVLDNNGELINLIAQSDIIHWLVKQNDKFDALFEITMRQADTLHPLIKKVHRVYNYCDTVVTALQLMKKYKVSGLAIVDEGEKLVGNISSTDLRVISESSKFKLLGLTVKEFMNIVNNNREPHACYLSSTIRTVLFHMASEQVRRMFLVDENFHLQGIITFTDIMNLIVHTHQHS